MLSHAFNAFTMHYNPTRGGLITMIHKSITFYGSIIKMTTLIDTLYLQISTITNTPLTPIVIIQLYVPTHKEDIHITLEIQQTIKEVIIA